MRQLTRLIKITSFFIGIVILIFFGCHKDEHRYIYLQNKSNKAIYYGLSSSYPDTSLTKIEDHPGNNGSIAYKVKSDNKTTLPAAFFELNSTIQLFIFDSDIIENNPWDSIVKHYLILKRYQFTELDMEKLDWTISYK
jgi:hypothetical protein